MPILTSLPRSSPLSRKRIDQGDRNAGTVPTPAPRRLLFISHANPEDNAFATWLATQLAIAGYEVWCDVTQLLGGERFWTDIEEAIDAHAFRLLFVSTRVSNRKPGTLHELALARAAQRRHGFKDFMVPLKLDDLPFESSHETLHGINFVHFDESWAAGLSQLLSLLEREGAPKSPTAGPACVTEWYRRSLDSRRQVVVSNDRCFSNWFEFRLPGRMTFHRYAGSPERLAQIATGFRWPSRIHGHHLATFAAVAEVRRQLGDASAFPDALEFGTDAFVMVGSELLRIAPFDAVKIVTDLVRQAWESTMSARGLGVHRLASAPPAWFFRHGQLPKNRAYFGVPGGRRTYRQLVGDKQ